MKTLTYRFNSTNREQLVEWIKGMAETLSLDEVEDLLISITGDNHAGKSLFWDVFRETLLENGGEKISEKIYEDPKHATIRAFEQWDGKFKKYGIPIPLSIACFNGSMNGSMQMAKSKDGLAEIIREKSDKKPNIVMSSKMPYDFEDMNIQLLASGDLEDWKRLTDLTLKSSKLLKNKDLISFLDRTCELVR